MIARTLADAGKRWNLVVEMQKRQRMQRTRMVATMQQRTRDA
jgi:hypothetical protein